MAGSAALKWNLLQMLVLVCISVDAGVPTATQPSKPSITKTANSTTPVPEEPCLKADYVQEKMEQRLASYDPRVTPAPAPPAPVHVNVTLHLRHVAIDERANSAIFVADLLMTWEDPRLSWNESDWCKTRSLQLYAERLWQPRVDLFGAASGPGLEPAELVRVTSGGSVAWLARLKASWPCALNLVRWPRDTQTCSFKFGSQYYNNTLLLLSSEHRLQADRYDPSGLWTLEEASITDSTYQQGDEHFSAFNLEVTMSREANALALGINTCCVALALLLLTAGLMQPQDRVAVLGTVSLGAAVGLWSGSLRALPGPATPRPLQMLAGLMGLAVVQLLLATLVQSMVRWSQAGGLLKKVRCDWSLLASRVDSAVVVASSLTIIILLAVCVSW